MPDLSQEFTTLHVDALEPHPDNPRRGDVDAIAESIRHNGFFGAVLVQAPRGRRKRHRIIAGEHRWRAAQAEGMSEVDVIVVDVDDAAARRMLLADNKVGDDASYDYEALRGVLEALATDDGGMVGTGYDQSDLDALLKSLDTQGRKEVNEDNHRGNLVPSTPVTAFGDVWTCGGHRIMCGDARDANHVAALLDGATVNLAFTSPPYADRRKYDGDSIFRPVPPEQYVEWFAPVAAHVATHLAPDGSWFVNIKAGVTSDGLDTETYVLDLVLAHARQWGWHFATEFCWERSGVPKNVTRRFKNQFESIYQFARGDWKMRPDQVRHESANVPKAAGPGVGNTSWAENQGGNGAMFGKDKRRQGGTSELMSYVQGTNAAPGEMIGPGMAYPGNRLPTFGGSHEATGHSAAFPVGLPGFFVQAYTDEGDTVYDPFLGSGSTVIAAAQLGRVGYGMECSPGYVDASLTRIQRILGEDPVNERTGEHHHFSTPDATGGTVHNWGGAIGTSPPSPK